MNRLRDDVDEDPTPTREIERLRNTPPTPAMPDMKLRVWNALQQGSRARASRASWRIFGLPGMKAVVLAVTVVALVGTAGAMITGRMSAGWKSDGKSDGKSGGKSAGKSVGTMTAPVSERSAPRSEPAFTPPVAVHAAGTKEPRSTTASSEHHPVRIVAGPVRPVISSAQARTEVLDALVALRRNHDPVRAGALLDKYLVEHARGALREEALVLAIEAADARGDDPAGRRWALIYQAEYPQGRFRAFAQSHDQSKGSRPPQDK